MPCFYAAGVGLFCPTAALKPGYSALILLFCPAEDRAILLDPPRTVLLCSRFCSFVRTAGFDVERCGGRVVVLALGWCLRCGQKGWSSKKGLPGVRVCVCVCVCVEPPLSSDFYCFVSKSMGGFHEQ